MLKRIPILLCLLSLGACCCGVPTGAAPTPIHAVKLGDWFYLLVDDQPVVQGGPVLGHEFARVLRRIDCDGVIHLGDGQIEDPCGFQEGDSDLLPAGTTLHAVDGIPGGQRLGAVLDGRLLIFAIRYPPD